MSTQSVPVLMATSATSRHRPCKWIHPDVTRRLTLSFVLSMKHFRKTGSHRPRVSRKLPAFKSVHTKSDTTVRHLWAPGGHFDLEKQRKVEIKPIPAVCKCASNPCQ